MKNFFHLGKVLGRWNCNGCSSLRVVRSRPLLAQAFTEGSYTRIKDPSIETASMLAGIAVLFGTCSYLETGCEESSSTKKEEKKSKRLWPEGVNKVDIDELVDEIMKDPTVNLSFVPDAVERRMYKSTIQLTLNAFYRAIASVDGIPFLSHQIIVSRATTGDAHKDKMKDYLAEQTKTINIEILEEVADRLLANPAINSRMLPDVFERQIYVSCMIVVFRVLAIIVNSFRITICGHDLGLSLEPHHFEGSAVNAVARSSLSLIDVDQIKKFAQECGIPEDDSDTMTEEFSLWDRIWNRKELMVKLHTGLYSLVLGILDDILANTKIRVLSDDITLDVVPTEVIPIEIPETTETEKDARIDTDLPMPEFEDNTVKDETGSTPNRYFAIATFAAGVGVGAASIALAGNRK